MLTIRTGPGALDLITRDLHARAACGRRREVVEDLRAMREVDLLTICAGSFNCSASATCQSREHLVEAAMRFHGLDGVKEVDVRMHPQVLNSNLE